MWHFDGPRNKEIMNLKYIFSILFFEHGYLSHYSHSLPEIYLCAFLRFFLKEACLKYSIEALVFILWQKTGNFL